jgi:phage tail sheath protein FI
MAKSSNDSRDWKAVSARDLTMFIDDRIGQATKWIVFEPNNEKLWAKIRLRVGAFMDDLFRQGAFKGRTPQDAYYVKCDRTTMSQTDLDEGVVNILVGFAPRNSAEFVVIQISQITGQTQSGTS